MAKWEALCNGGPNNVTVGKSCDSLGQAIGTRIYEENKMCIAAEKGFRVCDENCGSYFFCRSMGMPKQGVFVQTEKEAGGAKK